MHKIINRSPSFHTSGLPVNFLMRYIYSSQKFLFQRDFKMHLHNGNFNTINSKSFYGVDKHTVRSNRVFLFQHKSDISVQN